MPADIGVVLIGAHHHGHGIPANQALDVPLDRAVARISHLFLRRNGVDVGGIPAQRDSHAQVGGAFHQVFEQVTGPVGPDLIDDFVESLNPFGGFLGVEVVGRLYFGFTGLS